ncbi:DUF559 domain-containing protein [Nocardia sp. NPDC004151]|uniref:DUF559 domain-containing protein n=1 Tax=Nocardia sp. NPDC004151 TaxID=3364304 RepID=UPI0036C71272
MIVTRAELSANGIPKTTIDNRCRRGTYTRLLPGVYSTDTPDSITRCRAIAAWLPQALLSHRTAAWLQGMSPTDPTLFEATAPKHLYRKTPPWLHLYRRNLPDGWATETQDLPITHPALTLLDCLTVLPRPAAEAMIDEHLGRTVSPTDALRLSHSNVPGRTTFSRHLREAATRAASDPERLFTRALKQRGLTLLSNHPVGQYICDLVDERSYTIIEIDGREFHSAPAVFRQDRRRQNDLILAGWLVLRYAASDVYRSLDRCADEAATVIKRRRRRYRGH